VIGEGVVTALLQHADVIGERVGGPLKLAAVADKDPARLDIVRAQDPNISLIEQLYLNSHCRMTITLGSSQLSTLGRFRSCR
jgi:hypothetical protein